MRAGMLILAVLLSGCASQFQVNSGTVGLSVQSHTSLGALLTIGLLSTTVYADGHDHWSGFHGHPMEPSRKVHEQDCTRPIEDWSANLRCR